MHAVPGGAAGSGGDAVRARVLLDVHRGLGEGEAGVSAVSAGGHGAAYFASEGCVIRLLGG